MYSYNGEISNIIIAREDKLKIGKNLVIHNGALAKRYSERRTKKYMRNNSILIEIDLGVGDSQSSIWTCDLTEKYVKINADYRS